MRAALDLLDVVEMAGVHIPARSRSAILTAIMAGVYDSHSTDGTVRKEKTVPDTAIAEAQLKPVFGL